MVKRLIIVSGLSGSGKTVALNVLEDLGYFAIDNLPITLLDKLTEDFMSGDQPSNEKIALGVDARTKATDLNRLSEQVSRLKSQDIAVEILFLQTSDEVLLKRYSETRRRHPLATDDMSLRDAIDEERRRLTEVLVLADLIIDTTRTSVYELRDLVRERVAPRESHRLSVLIESFGYKHGLPPDADYVFDLRCLPNPYWEPHLRRQTGLDHAVIDYLDSQPVVAEMRDSIIAFCKTWLPQFQNFSRSYLTIALGCTGGQHRSVYMAERIARALNSEELNITIRHNELLTAAGHASA